MKLKRFRFMNEQDATAGGGVAAPVAAEATTLLSGDPTTTPVAADPATQVADQQTPTDPATAADKPDEEAKPPEKVVPEKYEFTAPEGVTLDSELLGEFEALAKDAKLSQEEAQKVADIGAKMAQKLEAKQADLIQQAAADWTNASVSDKEFGGDALQTSLATAQKALNAFGTPELRQLLNGSRLGNHPEVIRFMVRAGKAISEDRMVTSGSGAKATPTSHAEALYPSK